LRLAVRPDAELVGSLVDHESQNPIDPRHEGSTIREPGNSSTGGGRGREPDDETSSAGHEASSSERTGVRVVVCLRGFAAARRAARPHVGDAFSVLLDSMPDGRSRSSCRTSLRSAARGSPTYEPYDVNVTPSSTRVATGGAASVTVSVESHGRNEDFSGTRDAAPGGATPASPTGTILARFGDVFVSVPYVTGP
jgi:hypothetical protein